MIRLKYEADFLLVCQWCKGNFQESQTQYCWLFPWLSLRWVHHSRYDQLGGHGHVWAEHDSYVNSHDSEGNWLRELEYLYGCIALLTIVMMVKLWERPAHTESWNGWENLQTWSLQYNLLVNTFTGWYYHTADMGMYSLELLSYCKLDGNTKRWAILDKYWTSAAIFFTGLHEESTSGCRKYANGLFSPKIGSNYIKQVVNIN